MLARVAAPAAPRCVRIALAIALFLLPPGCGAVARSRAAVAVLPPAADRSLAPTADVMLDAAPALQRLVDPYRSEVGPSWLGGDVASSIPLAADRWVWLFGDTLLGTLRGTCGDPDDACTRSLTGPDAGMIANSAGVMVRDAAGVTSPVVKYWRADATGAPAPIFGDRGDQIVWPLAGVRVGQVLLVAANLHTRESGLLPIGNVLIRVWNPDAPPDLWQYDARPVDGFHAGDADGRGSVSWTSALVAHGEHVYLLGSRDVGPEARTVLARVPARAISDTDAELVLEYLLDDPSGTNHPPRWSATLDVHRLHEIAGLPGTSEATIDAAPGVGWYTFRIPALYYEIRLYTASNLLGPWRDRGVVYEIPATWRATVGSCTDAERATTDPAIGSAPPGCAPLYAAYAPKAHPELAAPGGYVVSYNVNTWAGGLDGSVRALENLDGFYVPRMLASEP